MELGMRKLASAVLALAAWPAALVAAALAAAAPARAEMRMALAPVGDALRCGAECPLVMQLEGQITGDTADRFVAFARSSIEGGRLRNIVFLHSPGGSVIGSLKLGAVFRALGTTVVVARVRSRPSAVAEVNRGRRGDSLSIPTADLLNATCNSACVYALMGGKSRVIPPESRLGIHRMEAEVFHGLDVASGSAVFERKQGSEDQVRFLERYARQMGIDPKLIALAESIPHDDIRILSRADVRRFRLGRERL
jgi:hypothetical protein